MLISSEIITESFPSIKITIIELPEILLFEPKFNSFIWTIFEERCNKEDVYPFNVNSPVSAVCSSNFICEAELISANLLLLLICKFYKHLRFLILTSSRLLRYITLLLGPIIIFP